MKWRDVKPKPQSEAAGAIDHRSEGEVDDATFATDDGAGETGEGDVSALQPENADGPQPDDDAYRAAFASLPDVSGMSSDEVFQKAVEASYWAGFWAGAYRVSIRSS